MGGADEGTFQKKPLSVMGPELKKGLNEVMDCLDRAVASSSITQINNMRTC